MVRAAHASSKVSTMRSDFVSAATHELKTPIATIRTAAETLSMERSPAHRSTVQPIVLMEANRLGRLIENMLAYSRIVDAADTTRSPGPVAAIFNDIRRTSRLRSIGSASSSLGHRPDVSAVRGDRVALRLLFGTSSTTR